MNGRIITHFLNVTSGWIKHFPELLSLYIAFYCALLTPTLTKNMVGPEVIMSVNQPQIFGLYNCQN
jgi:hypothetical protein